MRAGVRLAAPLPSVLEQIGDQVIGIPVALSQYDGIHFVLRAKPKEKPYRAALLRW